MSLQGKDVVVTGATDGIGKVTARELARQGAKVTLVGRNAAKGDSVVRELRAVTGNDDIHFLRGKHTKKRSGAAAKTNEMMS